MSREACLELARRLGVDPEAVAEDWAERAAIRELDGGMTREDAEQGALDDVRRLYGLSTLTAGDTRLGPRSAAPLAPAAVKQRTEG
jgi:hypothetical protein